MQVRRNRPVKEQASLGTQSSNAEILLWQGNFRRVFAVLVGPPALALKWAGLLRADSIFVPFIGINGTLGVAAGAMVAYVGFITAVNARISRTGTATRGVLYSVLVADYMAIFVVVAVSSPPDEYPRSLILSIFIIQFTRVYFDLLGAVTSVVAASLGYATLIIAATSVGALERPVDHVWTLIIFLLGALIQGSLHGAVAGRVNRLLSLFERAQEGDFSGTYDESLDRMPDPITMIGRRYNQVRLRLQTTVLTDPLSGCYNRRGFEQLCAREIARAVRVQQPMSVLAIDVDHFKKINDELGHPTGDEVLREMGIRLRETARTGDVVGRIGGEEFEILAPDTTAAGAQILADRIQAALRGKPFTSLGGTRCLGVSIGIATAQATDDQVGTLLIARADEALYVAKRDGRDRTQVWESGLRAFDGAVRVRRSVEIGPIHATDLPVE